MKNFLKILYLTLGISLIIGSLNFSMVVFGRQRKELAGVRQRQMAYQLSQAEKVPSSVRPGLEDKLYRECNGLEIIEYLDVMSDNQTDWSVVYKGQTMTVGEFIIKVMKVPWERDKKQLSLTASQFRGVEKRHFYVYEEPKKWMVIEYD